jgi:hypothetical protein
MKTVLIALGALFVLSRLNHGGLTLSLGGNAAPAGTAFHPTPPAGGAASLIPPGGDDPYANLNGGGGCSGIPISSGGAIGGGTSPSLHTLITNSPGSVRGGTLLSRVTRTNVRTA